MSQRKVFLGDHKNLQERVEELYQAFAELRDHQSEMTKQEEDFVYRYNIKDDEEFANLLKDEQFIKDNPEYHKLVITEKEIITKKVNLEEDMFNVKKGLYLGIGVDLDNISTKVTKVPIYLPWENLVNHLEILGTTRFGKTYLLALIAKQIICLKKWDVILFDPKGGKEQELLSWMVQFACEAGREEDIAFYNPAYIEHSDLLNPLYGMDNEEIASVCALLSEGDGDKSDDFFSSIVYIIILTVTYSVEYLQTVQDPDGEITKELEALETTKYHKMINMKGMDLESYDYQTKVASPDASVRMKEYRKLDDPLSLANNSGIINRSLITFRELAYYSSYENLNNLLETVKALPVPPRESLTQEQYEKVAYLKTETMGFVQDIENIEKDFYIKISMSMTALLTKLSKGSVGKLFCTIRVNPLINRLYREDKGILAVIQPAPLKFQKVSDMVNKVFIKMFESMFGTVSVTGRTFKRRVALLIDEAKAALFPGIEELYNKAGGMGMTIMTLMQSSQDRVLKVGETRSKIISDNTNSVVTLKTNNNETKDEIIKNIGTVRQHKRMFVGDENQIRVMVNSADEDVINTNNIDNLKKGQAFVQSYGKRYRLNIAHVESPKGEIIMPSVNEEERVRVMSELETLLDQDAANKIHTVLEDDIKRGVANETAYERIVQYGKKRDTKLKDKVA